MNGSSNFTGLSPHNPSKYRGPNVALGTVVSRNREPTGADYRQPETGKLYPFNTFWLVGINPTSGIQGDLWYLSKIVANVAFWIKLAGGGGSGDMLGIIVDAFTPPGTNPVLPNAGFITVTGGQVASGVVGTNVIRTDSLLANTFTVEIQRSNISASSNVTLNGVCHFDSKFFTIDANAFVSFNGSADGETITGDDGIVLPPTAGNWNIFGQQAGTIPVMQTNGTLLNSILRIEDRTWTTQYIVDPSATVGLRGTFSTIASAIAAASSGQTIFIRAGTYTENITLSPGINLAAYNDNGLTPNVTIIGKCTMTGTGKVAISGIRLQTNGDFCISVTGSNASVLNLVNCYINCTNNTGIQFTSSNGGAQINTINTSGSVNTTGIALYSHSSAGSLFFDRSYFSNSGGTTTNNTASSGQVFHHYTYMAIATTTSSTCTLTATFSYFSTFSNNITALTQGGNNLSLMRNCTFKTGSATAISISTGLNLQQCSIECDNASIISGAGTLTYSAVSVNSTTPGWTFTITSQVARYMGQMVFAKAFGTNYTPTATSYQVLRSDCIIAVTSTASARTITMPAAGMEIGQVWTVKDESGGALVNNITISGNGVNIDGAATKVISTNYGFVNLYWNGSQFFTK
jgi:hypothetical protein